MEDKYENGDDESNKDEKVVAEKHGHKPRGQRRSTYGTEFPCIQCSNSYNNYDTLRNHVRNSHDERNLVKQNNYITQKAKNSKIVDCVYCTSSFFGEEALSKHTLACHKEDLFDSPNAGEDQPTSSHKASIRLAVDCPFCNERRATSRAMLFHIQQDHPENENDTHGGDASVNKSMRRSDEAAHEKVPGNEPVKCSKCDKQYMNNEFLKKHLLAAHPASPQDKYSFCPECGEVIRFLDISLHRSTCLSVNTRSSEAQGDARDNEIHFTPPLAKRCNQRSSPPPFVDMSGSSIVKTEVDEEEHVDTSSLKPKGPIANPQAVIRKQAESFDQRPNTMNGSSASTEERIQKKSHPLTAGVYIYADKYPNELLVIWTVSIDEDLLQTVSEKADNSILCVQKLTVMDSMNLNVKQKELFSRSKKITFYMLDENNSCTQWTVLSFGSEISPSDIEGKLFKNYADVEKVFYEHARKLGKTLHNCMRCSGLFPLLSQHLQKKITGFNQ